MEYASALLEMRHVWQPLEAALWAGLNRTSSFGHDSSQSKGVCTRTHIRKRLGCAGNYLQDSDHPGHERLRPALERRCRTGDRHLALALSERFYAAKKLALPESKRETPYLGNLFWFQPAGH